MVIGRCWFLERFNALLKERPKLSGPVVVVDLSRSSSTALSQSLSVLSILSRSWAD